MGYIYYRGYGVAQDYNEAFKWFLKSAEMDNEWGVSWIGLMYEYGYGVTKNHTEAFKWYRKSAEKGNSASMSYLGSMYRDGQGINRDYDEALKWYRKSAELGNTSGMCGVGFMYSQGYGVTQDKGEAVKWYRKSAEKGDLTGMFNLGIMYMNGSGVGQSYPEAEKWLLKSAEAGYSHAQCELGKMYYTGIGSGSNSVAKNEKKGEELLRKAADRGNTDAKTYIEDYIGFRVKIFVYIYENGKKEPLIGGSVSLVNSKGKYIDRKGMQTSKPSYNATTDFDGNCSMPLKKGDRLMISYPGFRTSYVTIDENAKNQTIECRLYE